jgi:iron complex outermembrane recepter protein
MGRLRKMLSAVLVELAFAIWAPFALAQATGAVDFDIPAQPLEAALRHIAEKQNLQLFFAPEDVRDLKAKEVRGKYTPFELIRKLLEGTELEAIASERGVVTIRPRGGSKRQGASPTSSLPGLEATPGLSAGTRASSSSIKGEKIEVTGSRLPGTVPTGVLVRTIDRDEIARSGYLSTEQLIKSIPANFGGGGAGFEEINFSPRGVDTRSSYGSGVNLRGLGTSATLVLVNGHRIASSGEGFFTDVSWIPISAIDHIDVLSDGASAIYGSDAIAGVVNIVLKREGEGVETGLRYGRTTQEGFSRSGGHAQVGTQWANGGIMLGVDASRQGVLDTKDRPFTPSDRSPTSIVPSYDRASMVLAAQQVLSPIAEVHGDVTYSEIDREAFTTTGTTTRLTRRITPSIDRWNASLGGSIALPSSWTLRYDATGGREVNENTINNWANGSVTSLNSVVRADSSFFDHNIGGSGNLFTLPAGPIKMAVGAGYRTERFKQDAQQTSGELHFDVERNVKAAYVEVRLPVVSEGNAVPGIRKLILSTAIRNDRYSDFGSTTNPKYGVSWTPTDDLQVRASYSTSFRAPAAGTELVNTNLGITGVLVQPTPGVGASAPVPIVLVTGASQDLGPEKARNFTAGFDITPRAFGGLRLSLNYFDIRYTDKLATPPFSGNPLNDPAVAPVITRFSDSATLRALVNAAVANGALFLDITGGAFGSNPLESVVYLYDFRTQNLSRTEASGIDASAQYSMTIGMHEITGQLDVTYIKKLVTSLTSTSPRTDQVNTVGFPASLRLRGLASWSRGNLSLAGAVNYVGHYRDTSSAIQRDVGSYLTFDLLARYDLSALSRATKGTHVILGVTNAFDRDPPFVSSGAVLAPGTHYDAVNASAVGRFISLQVTKRW